MRHHRPLILALALGIAVAGTTEAGAFGTIRALGQNSEHERITRRALACPPGVPSDNSCFEPATLDELAGKAGTFGAIGIPDRGPLIEDASFHCDGGDHLAVPGYPQSKAKARKALAACRTRMVQNLRAATVRAGALLDDQGRIRADQVSLGCVFVGGISGRAKCNVLESMGLMLHTAQDFYAHTNWTDRPGKGLIGPGNPPGLSKTAPAQYIDLRGRTPFPVGLISGCFGSGPVILPIPGLLGKPESKYCNYGFLGGLNRVKHRDLNKDEGTIDPVLKNAGATSRGKVNGNFGRAVRVAAADTSDKWATLGEALVARYGRSRGTLMICAIVRDDPVRDCQGRSVALVLDSSGSNRTTDPGNLRIEAALSVASDLVGTAEAAGAEPDRLAVVDFDSSARVTYPPGDPDGAAPAIRATDSAGGTNIATGIRTATAALGEGGIAAGKSGIVVLTDGQDSNADALAEAIRSAGAVGIRVSIGFLSPPAGGLGANALRAEPHQSQAASTGVVQQAVVATGGVFGTIRSAEEQAAFADLVEQRGLTAVDDPDGVGEGGDLAVGVEVAGVLGGADEWTYTAGRREGLKVTLTPPAGASGRLTILTTDGRRVAARAGSGAPVIATLSPPRAGTLRIRVAGAGTGAYTLRIDPDPTARVPARPREKAKVPAVAVLRRPKLSLVRGGPAVRTARRGRAAILTWRVRARRGTLVVRVSGPRGERASAKVRLRRTARPASRSVVATLPIIGRRRGLWRVQLTSGRTIVDQTAVRTR